MHYVYGAGPTSNVELRSIATPHDIGFAIHVRD